MMRPYLIGLFYFLVFSMARAQYSETIQSSRPGASDVPFTTGKKVFQIQTGVSYTDTRNSLSKTDRFGINYSFLARYGLFERFELRTGLIWRAERIHLDGQEGNLGGLAFWNLGFRINVINGHGTSPSFGIESDIRFPHVGAPEYQIEKAAPRLFLLFNTPLIGKISFTTNLGLVWEELGKDPFASFTLNLSAPISSKASIFIESFGNIFLKLEGFNFDGGFAYLANDNLQFDLSVAYLGINSESKGWWVDMGVSWRIRLKDKH